MVRNGPIAEFFIGSGAKPQCSARMSRTATVSPKFKNRIEERGRDYLGNFYHHTISYLWYKMVLNSRHNKTTNTYPPIKNTVAEATALIARKTNCPRFSDCLYRSLPMSGHPHSSSNRAHTAAHGKSAAARTRGKLCCFGHRHRLKY